MKKKLTLIGVFIFTLSLINAQTPNYTPTNGLKGWWPFTGNANDVSVNGNNGTVNVATLTNDRFNSTNNAYSFNGTTSFISTNYAGILGSNARAVSFWAKSTFSTTIMSAVAWGNNNTATRYNCMFNYGAPGVTVDGGNGAITYSGTNTFDNNWHHYVYQFSNPILNQVQVYQDGVLLTLITASYAPTNTLVTTTGFNVHFGRIVYSSGDLFYNGSIDDIGIWDRVLTNCEILELYHASHTIINITSSTDSICRGQTLLLNASGANTYTWNTNSNSSSISVNPSITTVYTVSGTSTLTGCSNTNSITIIVSDCTGLKNYSIDNTNVNIYPNPNNGSFYIITKETTEMTLVNMLGQTINKMSLKENSDRIEIKGLAEGIYFIVGETNKSEWRKKIVVSK